LLRINLGYRIEDSLQKVTDPLSGELLRDPADLSGAEPKIEKTYELPSASITWTLFNGWEVFENMQARVAFSESINRPILRELAPVAVYIPDDGRIYEGNTKLNIAEIENFDSRYEWYFGYDDYFSASWFKKNISHPIELVEVTQGDGDIYTTWRNSESAVNHGLEYELRKYLHQFVYLNANATIMDSLVEDSLDKNKRPLVGSSKEIYNFQLVYDDESLTISLAWNRFSKRIFAKTQSGLVWEQPFSSIDLSVRKKYMWDSADITVGLTAKNMLDESVDIRYENGFQYDYYREGVTIGLSLKLDKF
jgi:outer membrane receptor protein involved in Fe transport